MWYAIYPSRSNFRKLDREGFFTAPTYFVEAEDLPAAIAVVKQMDGRVQTCSHEARTLAQLVEDYERTDACPYCTLHELADGARVPMWENT